MFAYFGGTVTTLGGTVPTVGGRMVVDGISIVVVQGDPVHTTLPLLQWHE